MLPPTPIWWHTWVREHGSGLKLHYDKGLVSVAHQLSVSTSTSSLSLTAFGDSFPPLPPPSDPEIDREHNGQERPDRGYNFSTSGVL